MAVVDLSINSIKLVKLSFDNIIGWSDDDHLVAFLAFLPGAERMQSTPYKTRGLDVDGEALRRAGAAALDINHPTASLARQFFENEFLPHKVTPENGDGFVTGFFEPLVKASLVRSNKYSVPLYCRPPELIDLDEHNRPPSMNEYFRFGQVGSNGVEEYFDRPAIQSGALEGRGLELVWLENKVDVFFIHVQGAAKLALDTGGMMRVTYAAKSGHPYTSVAKVLCKRMGVQPAQMTADRLADWMRSNPDKIDELLTHNRSYIFFKQVEGLDHNQGPIAAAKVPLVAGRSLAVDRTLHTFGVPIWLTTETPLPEEKTPFSRLMIAHDTGSAIVGSARGDIFTGTGEQAGLIAGRIRHDASMTILVPKQ
ncbi:MAG: MltA domain-containing protein [Rhizobiaceae bacterium]